MLQETPTRPKPQAQKPKSKSKLSLSKLLSTRGGTIAVALVVAILGGGALLAFLENYRDSVDNENKPVTVLVAKDAIEKGTPGDVIASNQLFQTTTLPQSEVKDQAITDPGTLRGQVARREIFPGQQLTAGEFVRKVDPVGGKLAGTERAIAIPVDQNRGLIGQVDAGDRVDILAGWNVQGGTAGASAVLRTLVQNALVLDAPEEGAGGTAVTSAGGANKTPGVIVRVNDRQAAAIAFANEYGKVWLSLRPAAGAEQSRMAATTLRNLLTGLPPLSLEPRRGRRSR